MTTVSLNPASSRSLPRNAFAIALTATTLGAGAHFAATLLREPDEHWVMATALAALAMVATTVVALRTASRRLRLMAVAAQSLLFALAPLLAWLYERRDPGGLGSVVEGIHHRVYSGLPFHYDIPMSVVLGLAPLHFLALARTVDPEPRRRWLLVPFVLATLTTCFAALALALTSLGAQFAPTLLAYLLAVVGMSGTRLAVAATGFVLVASLLMRRGRHPEAALALPVTVALGLALMVAPAYRFHLENLGYKPLSVGLILASGLALAMAGRGEALTRAAHLKRHLRRLSDEQIALERDALSGMGQVHGNGHTQSSHAGPESRHARP